MNVVKILIGVSQGICDTENQQDAFFQIIDDVLK